MFLGGKMENIKIMSLWENKDKNGETYYSGKLGDAKILIFRNKYKKTDKEPAMNVFISQAEKPKEQKHAGQDFTPLNLDYRTGKPMEEEIPF